MPGLWFKPEGLPEFHLGGCFCTPRIVGWITGSSQARMLESVWTQDGGTTLGGCRAFGM